VRVVKRDPPYVIPQPGLCVGRSKKLLRLPTFPYVAVPASLLAPCEGELLLLAATDPGFRKSSPGSLPHATPAPGGGGTRRSLPHRDHALCRPSSPGRRARRRTDWRPPDHSMRPRRPHRQVFDRRLRESLSTATITKRYQT